MIGLTSSKVYNSFFNITEENTKFKLYRFSDEKSGGVSSEKVRDEIEKDLGNSDITAPDLQNEIIAPFILKEYREQVTKIMKGVGYVNFLAGYIRSIFQDFESCLRREVDLVEDYIRLILNEYNSNFITYELEPGFYTIKDHSESVFIILQPE